MFTAKLLKAIHNRDKAIKTLKNKVKDLNKLLVARNNNKYVRRFNNEMLAEYAAANPDCLVARVPDANEIYKRYYELKTRVGK